MRLVVADTGPLLYLFLLGHIGILQRLYGEVLAPAAVVAELRDARAPAAIRMWAESPPAWILVHPDPPRDPSLPSALDAGERAALALALAMRADLILADDRAARTVAHARDIETIGTVGILDLAARRGLVDLPDAIARLRATNFRFPSALFDALLAQHRGRP